MSAPYRYLHVRNAVTYLSILAALAAVLLARGPRGWSNAGAAIALSVLADIWDGRFARLFHRDEREKLFGAELDSLADALAFGFAPVAALAALVPPAWALARGAFAVGAIAWLIATVTRLGFYNVHPELEGFIGVPTTLAGLAISTLFLARPDAAAAALALAAGALAMVLPFRIARPGVAGTVVVGAWCLGVLALHVLGIG